MEGHSRQNIKRPPMMEEVIWVYLGIKRECDIWSEMMETMHSMKTDSESIRANNEKLLKGKVEKEEINDIAEKINW